MEKVMKQRLTAEFIGTFFLVTAIGLTGSPWAIGLALMGMVYIGGHISGAHYNPAVTLAFLIRKVIDTKTAGFYMVTQVIAALIGVAFVRWVAGAGAIEPGSNDITQVVAIEILFTFVLAAVILSVASARKLKGNMVYGLAIGLTLAGIIMVGGDISGGVFNPAVGIGFNLFGGTDAAMSLAYYLPATFIGGALAGWVFGFLED